jgi:UDP-N-acetyl-D-mannosaminuronic acid transferase (WecB/TagA/CpsF family)
MEANVALTDVASFDHISGELLSAPRWMTDNGLEWIGRMLIEPCRLWKRCITGNPPSLWRAQEQRLKTPRSEKGRTRMSGMALPTNLEPRRLQKRHQINNPVLVLLSRQVFCGQDHDPNV